LNDLVTQGNQLLPAELQEQVLQKHQVIMVLIGFQKHYQKLLLGGQLYLIERIMFLF
jgi:hypothetical protein